MHKRCQDDFSDRANVRCWSLIHACNAEVEKTRTATSRSPLFIILPQFVRQVGEKRDIFLQNCTPITSPPIPTRYTFPFGLRFTATHPHHSTTQHSARHQQPIIEFLQRREATVVLLRQQRGVRLLEVSLVLMAAAVATALLVSQYLLPRVVQLRGGEHTINQVAHLGASAEGIVVAVELIAEIGVSSHVDLLVRRQVAGNQAEVVCAQAADHHEHHEAVQQEEGEDPPQGRAVPVEDRGVQEEQVGDRVHGQDGHEIFVVVAAHGVVDEGTAKTKRENSKGCQQKYRGKRYGQKKSKILNYSTQVAGEQVNTSRKIHHMTRQSKNTPVDRTGWT